MENMTDNMPGTNVSEEEYNRKMDEHVEAHRKLPPHMSPTYRKFLEALEDFMEEEGTPLPRHSHRFAPEALWPDEHP
jgi:hypothetical protein